MAAIGEATFVVKVDARRVLTIVQAMDMMVLLLKGYGHVWTDEEQAIIANATSACERQSLAVEPV